MTHLFLNSHRYPQPLRMRLCPYEMGICESDFVQPFEFSEADREELGGFGAGERPCGGWGEEALAVPAEGDGGWGGERRR